MFHGTLDLEAAVPVSETAIQDVLFERGLYWASGRSGVVNLVAAHKWFNLAALKGRPDAIARRLVRLPVNLGRGLIGIVNWKPGEGGPGPSADARVPSEVVEADARTAHLRVRAHENLPYQYLLVLSP